MTHFAMASPHSGMPNDVGMDDASSVASTVASGSQQPQQRATSPGRQLHGGEFRTSASASASTTDNTKAPKWFKPTGK